MQQYDHVAKHPPSITMIMTSYRTTSEAPIFIVLYPKSLLSLEGRLHHVASNFLSLNYVNHDEWNRCVVDGFSLSLFPFVLSYLHCIPRDKRDF